MFRRSTALRSSVVLVWINFLCAVTGSFESVLLGLHSYRGRHGAGGALGAQRAA